MSVILIHFDTPRYLRAAVDSALSQTYRDYELVVIDDGSTHPDVTPILDSLGGIPHVRVHRCETTTDDRAATCRYATLINWAVNGHVAGELVSFLMGDDGYMPDRLDRMVTLLDAGPHDIVYGSQSLRDSHGVEFGRRDAQAPLYDAFERVDINSVLLRKRAFQQVGGFDERPACYRNADAFLWAKLTGAGKVFMPVIGEPTDWKTFLPDSITENVLSGRPPWHKDPGNLGEAPHRPNWTP